MSDNIIDLTKRIRDLQNRPEQITPVEEYDLGQTGILMDPSLKLDVLTQHAAKQFTNGDLSTYKIHRLLDILRSIHQGIVPCLDLKSTIHVRQITEGGDNPQYSVYMWTMPIARMSEEQPAKTNRYSYQIEVRMLDIKEGSVTKEGWIYPVENMEFSFSEDEVITTRTARHLVSSMNNLIKINGGTARITDDGGYLVALPYGPKLAYVIMLSLEQPIVLTPKDS